jgi:cyclopropane fatty-acyl-phospholipid synthase-like methyltransferase
MQQKSTELTLEDLYSGSDIETLFPGGFINFGYYKNIGISNLSIEKRIQSQKDLYSVIHHNLHIQNNDRVLEVGIGHGGGPAWTAENFDLREMVGIDIFSIHVEKAKTLFKDVMERKSLQYLQCPAESICFPDNYFDKIYTIEAFQHFTNQSTFIDESYRVLSNGGKLAISTFFLSSEDALKELVKIMPKIAIVPSDLEKQNHIITINSLKISLANAGYKNIHIQSIGDNVWAGYDEWVKISENNWDRGWLTGYNKGLLDYYLITADK